MSKQQLSHDSEQKQYAILGYNRNNKVYELLTSCDDMSEAIIRLATIISKHREIELKSQNTDFFDWFNITNTETNEYMAVATLEYEEGRLITRITIY